MFVDLGLPLNIYLFHQSAARSEVGLGEVRGHGDTALAETGPSPVP